MYRRVVSNLLLPCVLLTQSVGVLAHSHCGRLPAGRDLRAHIHTNLGAPDSGHGHDHDDSGSHDGFTPRPQSQPISRPISNRGHDSDAIYIDRVDVVRGERSLLDDAFALYLLWDAAGFFSPTTMLAQTSLEGVTWSRAPAPPGYDCPIYLWQLTLLI